MQRLIHLNGPPGVGKSTIARRYVDDHPGTLGLDIDVLRTLVGGWADDYAGAGALVRPVALAAITAYLAQGQDVVLPQLIARSSELARFRQAAGAADYLHLVLTGPPEVLAQRFRGRPAGADPHDLVPVTARHVARHGADAALRHYYDEVHALAATDPTVRYVETIEGDVDRTYRAVCAVLG